MDQADPSPGRQLPHALHPRPHHAPGHAQGAPAQSHNKPPEATAEFQATWGERLPQRIPPDNTRPARVFRQDDRRFGVPTRRRRRLTACGVQPVGAIQRVCEGFSVDGAVAPTPGERVFLERPSLHADPLPRLVDAFAQAFPDGLHTWLVANSGAPTAQRIRRPEHGRAMWLPPYGPELNPSERGWRDLKDNAAWQQFPTLEAQQDAVGDWLRAYDALSLPSLTGDTYLVEAVNALYP